jgi:hypothetical protein
MKVVVSPVVAAVAGVLTGVSSNMGAGAGVDSTAGSAGTDFFRDWTGFLMNLVAAISG